MNKLVLWMACLGALCGQDLVGTWQGAVTPADGQSRRMVIKIARENGGLNATLYNIDANPRPVVANTVTQKASVLSITFVPGGLSYEGRASGDGNSITGNVGQGGNLLPLNLTRATADTAWTIPAAPPQPAQMAANAKLVFEVATIKPAPPDAQNKPFRVQGGQYQILNRNIVELLQEAYPLHAVQITGAKGWMESEHWDIVAKPAAAGQPNNEQLRQMIRSLLAERFQLKWHMEEKELPVYVITMGRTGQHKLKPTNAPPNLPGGDTRGAGTFLGRNSSIANLAELLQMVVLDRPVVDRTGIAGKFDFVLEWKPDEFQFGGRAASMQRPANVDSLPDLFTAFQEQLGLKLEAVKAPVQVLVIDSAQRPSEN